MTSEEKVEKAREILNTNPSEEDIVIAVGLTEDAVAEGNSSALYLMGQLCFKGIGVEHDEKKSLELCQKALEMGCERAKLTLAILYLQGIVVEQNLELAEQYLRDLMATGDDQAYYLMGNMVFQNAFPHIKQTECITFYKKAIELGNTSALLGMAEEYSLFCETEQADQWFRKAEEAGVQGVAEARARYTDDNYPQRRQNVLDYYIAQQQYDKVFALVNHDAETGDTYALYLQAAYCVQGLGEQAYGRDVQKALQIYERLVAEGESQAYFFMGQMYGTVEEIENKKKSFEYYMKAAEAGHPDAQLVVGRFYLSDMVDAKDEAKALEWIEMSAAQNQPDALFCLAASYLQDAEVGAVAEWTLNFEKDEAKGMELMQRAAEADSYRALYCLALCHQKGKYLEQDDKKAFELMDRSCQLQVTPEKVSFLADSYYDGEGVEQDYERAFELYQWAANNGDAHSVYFLAQMYAEGKGVEKDEVKANELMNHWREMVSWQYYGIMPLKVAIEEAEKGNAEAMSQLGNRYQAGNEVEQNIEKAVEWWQKASEAGSVVSTHNLGVYYNLQNDAPNAIKYLTQSFSAGYLESYITLGQFYLRHDELEDHIQKGINCLATAGEQGNAASQWELASIYHDGKYGLQDPDKARYWLEKCLAADYPMAHYGMAISLLNGDLYEKDPQKALEHLRMAVKGGAHEADDTYINMRWDGGEAERNREEVLEIYKELAENNDAVAMLHLYEFYSDDTYEEKDMDKAIEYLNHSAQLDYDEAKAQLGRCYEFGMGVEKDISKAVELYKQAEESGTESAARNLAVLYILGAEGCLDPDCDKAIELLQPYLVNENIETYYLMAYAVCCKCEQKNGYLWELASQSFDYMLKAANAGYVSAMSSVAYCYMEGKGVLADEEEAKVWIQKALDAGSDDQYLAELQKLSDEDYMTEVCIKEFTYIKAVVENNIERIENPLPMEVADGNIDYVAISRNAAQLGELTAAAELGRWGLRDLKTDPENAKINIKLACQQGLPIFAEEAGQEWLKDGMDNDKSLKEAIEYFNMGIEEGSLNSFLQLGLLCTDVCFEGSLRGRGVKKSGKKFLQIVCETEGDYYEELRQKARARLEELEQHHRSAWSKIIDRVLSIFDKG